MRDNGLTLTFLALCLGALVAQALVGHAAFNNEQDQIQTSHISFWPLCLLVSIRGWR